MDTFSDVHYQQQLSSPNNQIEKLSSQLQLKNKLIQQKQQTINQLQQKLAIATQETKRLQFKFTQNTQQYNQKNIIHNQIQQLQTKIQQLQSHLSLQINLTHKSQSKYKEKQQELSHLIIVLNQVQEQFSHAKKFRDKTFQQEYNKLLKQCKKFQCKIRQVKDQNEFLRYEKFRLQEINKYKQNLYGNDICTISQHSQLSFKLADTQRQLNEYKAREQDMTKQRISIQTALKFKQDEIVNLKWKVYDLQKNNTTPPPPTLNPNFDFSQSQQYQETTKFPVQIDTYKPGQNFKPFNKNPLLQPVEYAKKIATKLSVSWMDIYYELNGSYILDHSNATIEIDEFVRYDWSKLKQANFYNTDFDVEKWAKMTEHAKYFPALDMVYLHCNPIAFVNQQDLSKFKRLKSIFFNYTDQTRGRKSKIHPVQNWKKQ